MPCSCAMAATDAPARRLRSTSSCFSASPCLRRLSLLVMTRLSMMCTYGYVHTSTRVHATRSCPSQYCQARGPRGHAYTEQAARAARQVVVPYALPAASRPATAAELLAGASRSCARRTPRRSNRAGSPCPKVGSLPRLSRADLRRLPPDFEAAPVSCDFKSLPRNSARAAEVRTVQAVDRGRARLAVGSAKAALSRAVRSNCRAMLPQTRSHSAYTDLSAIV